MAHQDFSETCVIFNEGVEKELAIDINNTASISIMYGPTPLGREVTVFEAVGYYLSASASGQCDIGIYKGSLSTKIGSVSLGTVSIPTNVAGSVTSTDFTSTDIVCVALTNKGSDGAKARVIIRYKDK